jgi:hypothetical protein
VLKVKNFASSPFKKGFEKKEAIHVKNSKPGKQTNIQQIGE